MVPSLWFEGAAKWRTFAEDKGRISAWTAGPGTCGAGVRMRLLPGEAPPSPTHSGPAPLARGPLHSNSECVGSTMPPLEAIRYSRGSLQILDQLLLPQQRRYEGVGSVRQAWEAIRAMKVRRSCRAEGRERPHLAPLTPDPSPSGAWCPGHSTRGLPQPRRGTAGGRRGTGTRRARGLRARRAELLSHRPAHRGQHGPRRPRPGRRGSPGGRARGCDGGGGPGEVGFLVPGTAQWRLTHFLRTATRFTDGKQARST